MKFRRFVVADISPCSWCLWLTGRPYGSVIACCAEHARLATEHPDELEETDNPELAPRELLFQVREMADPDGPRHFDNDIQRLRAIVGHIQDNLLYDDKRSEQDERLFERGQTSFPRLEYQPRISRQRAQLSRALGTGHADTSAKREDRAVE